MPDQERAKAPPPLAAFTPRERRIVDRCSTPAKVQEWLRSLPYNHEPRGPTLRTLRGVVEHGNVHCAEAALAAATILEQHGWPPRLLVFDSIDGLGHVLFLYKDKGRFGTVARSRDPGLHGRRPRYRNLWALTQSYAGPYVDLTGAINGYATFDLRAVPARIDWRLARRSVLAVETILNRLPMRRVRMPAERRARLRRRYEAYLAAHAGEKPEYYGNRDLWQ